MTIEDGGIFFDILDGMQKMYEDIVDELKQLIVSGDIEKFSEVYRRDDGRRMSEAHHLRIHTRYEGL